MRFGLPGGFAPAGSRRLAGDVGCFERRIRVGLFGRGRKKATQDDAVDLANLEDNDANVVDDSVDGDDVDVDLDDAAAEEPEEAPASYDRENGPWDVSERAASDGMIDLGPLRVPGIDGMQVSLETDQNTKAITGISIALNKSAVQIQVFAAPRTEGIWPDIRSEIAASVKSDGGSADVVEGPFGLEISAKLPVTTETGRKGLRPARFVGIDGPRWFVRGVFSGKAAFDRPAAAELEELLGNVVVVRGEEARAPRDTLLLTMPAVDGQPADGDGSKSATAEDFNPLKRGPEIAEVR